jgi:hypothetical protein
MIDGLPYYEVRASTFSLSFRRALLQGLLLLLLLLGISPFCCKPVGHHWAVFN